MRVCFGLWWWLDACDVTCSLIARVCHPFARQDPNAPKRAMSAFMLFSKAKRAEVKAQNPELKVRLEVVACVYVSTLGCRCHIAIVVILC